MHDDQATHLAGAIPGQAYPPVRPLRLPQNMRNVPNARASPVKAVRRHLTLRAPEGRPGGIDITGRGRANLSVPPAGGQRAFLIASHEVTLSVGD